MTPGAVGAMMGIGIDMLQACLSSLLGETLQSLNFVVQMRCYAPGACLHVLGGELKSGIEDLVDESPQNT